MSVKKNYFKYELIFREIESPAMTDPVAVSLCCFFVSLLLFVTARRCTAVATFTLQKLCYF